MRLILPYHLPV
nr:unnamed protein product [Callosobruchus analis]